MANIANADDFRALLEREQYRRLGHILALRVALRVLPMTDRSGTRNRLTLAMFRAAFISWVTAASPAYNRNSPAYTAAEAVYTAINAVRADAKVSSAARATAEATIAAANHSSGNAYNAAVSAEAATENASTIWLSISQDVGRIDSMDEGSAIRTMLSDRLWFSFGEGPIIAQWTTLNRALKDIGGDWEVWREWYERRFIGEAIGFGELPVKTDESLCIAIALKDNAFWDRDAPEVNRDIKAMLDAARVRPPAASSPQMASVRPRWLGERLVQDDAISSGTSPENIDAMAEALGLDLNDLANDLEALANVDKAALAMLRRASAQLVRPGASRTHIFRMANRLLELQTYSYKVHGEWSDENAARYSALTLQLDRLLATFPEILEYFASRPTPARSGEDVRFYAEIETEISEALRSEAAENIVDASVPNALDETRLDVEDDLGPWQPSLAREPRAIASVENMLASISNALSPLADRALKSLQSKAGTHADKAGDYATNVIVYVYKRLTRGATAAGAGTAASTALVATHIEILANAGPALGSLVAILTYVATRAKKADASNTETES